MDVTAFTGSSISVLHVSLVSGCHVSLSSSRQLGPVPRPPDAWRSVRWALFSFFRLILCPIA